jgi:hypothetical protein
MIESMLLEKNFTTDQILDRVLQHYPEWLKHKRDLGYDGHVSRKQLRQEVHQLCKRLKENGFDADFKHQPGRTRRIDMRPEDVEAWFNCAENVAKLNYTQKQNIGKAMGLI